MAGARRLSGRRSSQAREFWSLRDVSFTVSDGDALGIIGRNGAGKSTILKLITRITSPTTGTSRTRGRVAALLEVGTGFHPELTGRENIYLNGAILGMSRRDITRVFDDIVEFSGVERFLDTPVKRYSSGMGLRLGFAVAAHLEPDILVVDEILAVGDAEFQRKCLGRMEEAEKEGRTLVFVSHDLDSLSQLCSRALWLEAGRIRQAGDSRDLVRDYLTSSLAASQGGTALVDAGPVSVRRVQVVPRGRPEGSALLREDTLLIEVDFDLAEELSYFDLSVYLTNHRGVRVLDEAVSDHAAGPLGPGSYRARMEVPPILNVGQFSVGLWCGSATSTLLDEAAVTNFTLHGSKRNRPSRTVVLDLPIEVSVR
ncbi:ATP-binding cassette domain-containing protein [Geodermatophilus normandii]|uniref:ATP-binding cassette domain-containing protein n=2 Tax=Geodermatophilus normandii TaxID=1137989 RepID=A0A6P0GF83_9ACTN|nr:ATP-binding cassette domain-containing protein [Geodermatophilus normandii]